MPGDGDGHGDGDGDGDGDEDESSPLILSTTRLLRLRLGGASSAGCWGICSPEDCSGRGSGCALSRFGSEVEPEVPVGYPERFHFQETMLEFCIY